MRRQMVGGLGLAVVFALTTGTARAGELLVNPGFETGALAPWFQDNDFGGPENWNVTAADAHTGVFSATDVGNKEIRQNIAATPTADIVEVSFWLKQPESEISFVSLFYSDNTSTGFLVSPTGADWEFFDVTANLEAGKSLVGFSLYGYVGGGPDEDRTYLDDASIRTAAVPEPASLALAGLGLSAVAGRRLRNRGPATA